MDFIVERGEQGFRAWRLRRGPEWLRSESRSSDVLALHTRRRGRCFSAGVGPFERGARVVIGAIVGGRDARAASEIGVDLPRKLRNQLVESNGLLRRGASARLAVPALLGRASGGNGGCV